MTNASIALVNAAINSSAIPFCTKMRFAEVHAAPPFRIFARMIPDTVLEISASSKTITGAFPPSSIEQRIT